MGETVLQIVVQVREVVGSTHVRSTRIFFEFLRANVGKRKTGGFPIFVLTSLEAFFIILLNP